MKHSLRHLLFCAAAVAVGAMFARASVRATEHAVQLILPSPLPGADGRSVVLNSGHTCHDQELRFSCMVFPRLGDWGVTRVGEQPADAPPANVAEEVVTTGYFDESWRLEKQTARCAKG